MSENDSLQVDRRGFLQAGAVASASAVALGANGAVASAQDAAAKSILPTRKLGKTGVDVTILNVGTGAWRALGGAEGRLLRAAYEGGIRYFDTANAYGTEPAITRFFRAMPEAKKDTFIVTKDRPRTPKDLIAQLDKRLEVMERDSVDMFFMHGLGDDHSGDKCIEFLKSKEFRETADTIRKSGKAKFFGFSCHDKRLAEMLTVAAEENVVDAIMVKYSAFAAKDHPFNKALDACHAKGIGLISMKQLQGSVMNMAEIADKVPASLKERGLKPYQMLLHAIWTDERISSCCVSMKTTDQIADNTQAARNYQPLKTAELKAVHEMFLAAGPLMCNLCDGRCAEAAGTKAALGDLTRFLAYHEHSGDRHDARRFYAELSEEAKDWKDADLAAAQAACPNHLDFADLLPRVDKHLA